METMQLQPVRANINPSIITTIPSGLNTLPIIPKAEMPARTLEEEIRIEKKLPFIEANTKEVSIKHLKNECVVPVFSKDNEITISHPSFIETAWEAANKVFPGERIEEPSCRVSHVIKGRTPEAIHKPVKDLLVKTRQFIMKG